MISEDVLLARGAVYRKVPKGTFVFEEGSSCRYYYQLVKGCISWVNFDDDGKAFIHSIVQEGESFGELPLFDDEPYAANAMAECDSLIIQLPKPGFQQLLKERPELQAAFTKLMAQRLRYSFFISKELAGHNPERQILTLLDFFKKKDTTVSNEPFRINLTRQQLAYMTGLRVETVIRSIRKLNKKGRLLIRRGKVFLLKDDSGHKQLGL